MGDRCLFCLRLVDNGDLATIYDITFLIADEGVLALKLRTRALPEGYLICSALQDNMGLDWEAFVLAIELEGVLGEVIDYLSCLRFH